MADIYLKPQSPLEIEGKYIYPITYYDQIVMPDGKRWDGKTSESQSQTLKLTDEITGKIYTLSIRNGILTTSLAYKKITVITPPTIINYYAGETFNPYGMKIGAVTFDDEIHEITSYTYSTESFVGGETSIIISYPQGTEVLTIEVPINVYEDLNAERDLIDFDYSYDEDYDVYFIGEWKGTYMGQPSDIMVIPNHEKVVINYDEGGWI